MSENKFIFKNQLNENDLDNIRYFFTIRSMADRRTYVNKLGRKIKIIIEKIEESGDKNKIAICHFDIMPIYNKINDKYQYEDVRNTHYKLDKVYLDLLKVKMNLEQLL